jgi:nucleoside-diphosphate-sugar epimerase
MKIFVTGASGWIGSAVVPELLKVGHHVVGLARSDKSADVLKAAGVEVERGSLDDLDILGSIAKDSDGVIHLAFKHDIAFTGDFAGAAAADRHAVEIFGDALAGSDKPFVIASGVLGLGSADHLATEKDGLEETKETKSLNSGPDTRRGTAHIVTSFAKKGVRSSVVRLTPTVHGEGDKGFMATIVKNAKAKGKAGYVGDGANRWPAIHRLDAAQLFRLAVEKAPAGSVLHAVAEEGIPIRTIAEVIGKQLAIPVASIPADEVNDYFSFMAHFISLDSPASSEMTRKLLGWIPTHPGLIEDLEKGYYSKAL